MHQRPIIIGVSGASGSGKTSVSNKILEIFKDYSVMLLQHDYYYKDQSHLPFEERLKTNYDHPFAFDTDLFIEHIECLLKGESIEKPVYNYSQHTRSEEVLYQDPKDVIIVEGILIFEDKRLRDLMDIKVYVDTDSDICLARRILRDINERGRTIESVIEQYTDVVKPMYHQFIEPTKRYADIIVPEGGYNNVAIDLLATKIKSVLDAKDQDS